MADPYPYRRYGMVDTPTAMGGGVAFRPSASPGSMQGMPTQQARSYLEFLALQKKKREEEAAARRQHQILEAAPQGLIGTDVDGGTNWTDWVSERIEAEGEAGGHTDWMAEMASGTNPVALLNASADTSKVDHMLNAALRNLGEALIPSAQAAGPASAETSLLNQGPIPPGTAGIGDDPITEFKWVWNPYEQAEVRVPANWTDERIAASFEAAQTEAAVAPEPGSTFRGATNYELGPSLATRAARQDEGVTGQMYPETVEPVDLSVSPGQSAADPINAPIIAEIDQGTRAEAEIVTEAAALNAERNDSTSTDVSPTVIETVARQTVPQLVEDTVPSAIEWEARGFLEQDIQSNKQRYLNALNDIFGKAMILNLVASLTGAESNAEAFISMAQAKLNAIQDFDGKQRLQDIGRLVFFNADGTYNPPETRSAAFHRARQVGASQKDAETISGQPAVSTSGTVAAKKKFNMWKRAKGKVKTALGRWQDNPNTASRQALLDAQSDLAAIETLTEIRAKGTSNQLRDDMPKLYAMLVGKPDPMGNDPTVNDIDIPSYFFNRWAFGEDAGIAGIETKTDRNGDVYYLIGTNPDTAIRLDSYPLVLKKVETELLPAPTLDQIRAAAGPLSLEAFEAKVRRLHPDASEDQIARTVEAYRLQEGL
jgi:hypothetical protein